MVISGKLRKSEARIATPAKKFAKITFAAILLAFIAQALFEAPFAPIVWHATYIGCRAAWQAGLRPGWRFDLVAITINAAIYLTAILLLDALFRRLRKHAVGKLEFRKAAR